MQGETLGDRHPHTLISIYNLADLLNNQGKITKAIHLFTEELEGLVLLHGMTYQETRDSAEHLVELLRSSGQHGEAKALAAKHDVCNDSDDNSDDSDSDDGPDDAGQHD